MKKYLLPLLLAFSLLPAISFAQISDQLADTLQGMLKTRANLLKLKSVAAAVAFPDGSVWEGAYGNAGTKPTSPDMLFEMGSNTKTFTASIILELADEGKLKLDDTIYKFLPVHPDIAYGITIRQLLNHTSGIYDYTQDPDLYDFVNGDPSQIANIDSILKNWMGPMQFAPGSKWEYCNTNYLLLGKIIEAIEGIPYHESLRNRLLDQFGFDETFFDVYENYSITKAGTWLNDGQYYAVHFNSFMSCAWAAGAILATPSDLAKWAEALYGGHILPHSWLDSMKQTITINSTYKYGLGMFQRSYNGKTYFGHGGTTLQNSEMEYSASSDFSCVTVVNEQDKGSAASSIQNSLISLVEKFLPMVTGVAETPKNSIKQFPNPVTDHFNILIDNETWNKNPELKLDIYSLDGKLKEEVSISQPSVSVARGNIANGIYLLQVRDNSGSVLFRQKLILQ